MKSTRRPQGSRDKKTPMSTAAWPPFTRTVTKRANTEPRRQKLRNTEPHQKKLLSTEPNRQHMSSHSRLKARRQHIPSRHSSMRQHKNMRHTSLRSSMEAHRQQTLVRQHRMWFTSTETSSSMEMTVNWKYRTEGEMNARNGRKAGDLRRLSCRRGDMLSSRVCILLIS